MSLIRGAGGGVGGCPMSRVCQPAVTQTQHQGCQSGQTQHQGDLPPFLLSRVN